MTILYQLGIKAACEAAGAYCERVDEQIFDGNVLERVYNQISKADIIIAEMTGRNPNVFYEVGYAHALNKRVILLTQRADDIPFDLKQYSHIVYEAKINKMKSALEERIRWSIDNPQQSLSTVDINLEFYISGTELKNNPKIKLAGIHSVKRSGRFTIQYYSTSLDIHNPNKTSIDPNNFDIALVMDSSTKIDSAYEYLRSDAINLPNGQLLYNLNTADYIFPTAGIILTFQLYCRRLNFPKRTVR